MGLVPELGFRFTENLNVETYLNVRYVYQTVCFLDVANYENQ
jgi:hypothetical protein